MRKDNELLQKCNGDCSQGRDCDCFDGFEQSPWFWVLIAICLLASLSMPWWLT